MIGDAVAAGKRGNTYAKGPEFKKKNSEGRSYKHIAGERKGKSGGGVESVKIAKQAHRDMKGPSPGAGVDKQKPHKQKERKEVKHVDQGQILNEWAQGKRGSYR